MVWPHFQRQSGCDDCGLFAIASVYELCQGEDPTILKFNQFQMRSHLLSCYFNEYISAFPSTEGWPHHHVKKDNIKIFCSCRCPFRAKVDSMVECSSCKVISWGVWRNQLEGLHRKRKIIYLFSVLKDFCILLLGYSSLLFPLSQRKSKIILSSSILPLWSF